MFLDLLQRTLFELYQKITGFYFYRVREQEALEVDLTDLEFSF